MVSFVIYIFNIDMSKLQTPKWYTSGYTHEGISQKCVMISQGLNKYFNKEKMIQVPVSITLSLLSDREHIATGFLMTLCHAFPDMTANISPN